jgi:5-methyltetrahydropteroyltriglutamate--homocysteine methyltransferase
MSMATTGDNKVRATIVGSLPRPSWLGGAAEMFANWRLEGPMLDEAREDAVNLWVSAQEKAGIDVITDGEQRRRHYIWGFFEGLDCIDTINLGRRAQRAQRYHNEIAAARLLGGPDWRGPIFVDALRATLAMTDRPVKVTLPGPMTIVDSLVDTVGGRSEEQLAFRFAELLNQEALLLAEAGASVIQFDEPCFNVYVDKVKDWGIAALERAARGVTVKKAVHICYGYGTPDVKRWKSANTDWSHYEQTLPLLAASTIDQVSIETAASDVDVSVVSALRGKDVLLGVVDTGNETIETAETVAGRLHAALRYTDPGHLFACTDCGMMPLSRKAALGKLRALAAGATQVNATL